MLATAAVGGLVLAQVSTSFDLRWHVLSSGGGRRQSISYDLYDAVGQWAQGDAASTSYRLQGGFWPGAGVVAQPTPTRTPTATATPGEPSGTATPTPPPGDAYEVDDACDQAVAITTDGAVQAHTFNAPGDQDWVRFQAYANKSYILRIDNVGANVDAVALLYDSCFKAPFAAESNAFGPTVTIQWNCTASGWYYLQAMQNDPAVFGEGTNYQLSVALDVDPPAAPRSLRVTPGDQALTVQWRKASEPDVNRYRVWWDTDGQPPYSGVEEVEGIGTTFFAITGLTNGQGYYVAVTAVDFSGNESGYSTQVGDAPSPGSDATDPTVTLTRPSSLAVYTTTVGSLTVGGNCADNGSNLSRVRVRNLTNGTEKWSYGLSGSSAAFHVEAVPLNVGDNDVSVTVYDAEDNTGSDSMTIRRVTASKGAAVIVCGRNNSGSLQANINFACNRAYRVFQSAGFGAEDIYYLNPTAQDADSDGVNDVDATTTPTNVQAAIAWAQTKVDADSTFTLYMMDHGLVEGFCGQDCTASGRIGSANLNGWLNNLETASGCEKVNVIIEACHSGSFVDRFEDVAASISKDRRVVISSTGRTNNAYASAQGAYFSDAFFSAAAEGNSLAACYAQAKSAVQATGNNQTPWMDDNGDALPNPSDGAYASQRYLASFFGAALPQITAATLERTGSSGVLEVTVERGDEPVDLVWAAVYAPSFVEPSETTLELGVPLIALQEDPDQEGRFSATYNGFGEQGAYRVVIYAEDTQGNQALPKVIGRTGLYLPALLRNAH